MADSRDLHDGGLRRFDRADQGFGDRAFHLHAVLGRTGDVLGISAFYHDSAAALVADGRIVAAAQEERFTRKKHDAGFPHHAVDYCLDEAGISLDDSRLRRLLRQAVPQIRAAAGNLSCFRAARLAARSAWQCRSGSGKSCFRRVCCARNLRDFAPDYDWDKRLLFTEHHQSHAASAFFPSPFEEAAVLTMDGVGEWATTSLALGRGNKLEMLKEIHFPHSLGLLYSAFTYYTGFKVNSGEYKLMGLAPYGEPRYVQTILDHLIDVKPDGIFRLDQTISTIAPA